MSTEPARPTSSQEHRSRRSRTSNAAQKRTAPQRRKNTVRRGEMSECTTDRTHPSPMSTEPRRRTSFQEPKGRTSSASRGSDAAQPAAQPRQNTVPHRGYMSMGDVNKMYMHNQRQRDAEQRATEKKMAVEATRNSSSGIVSFFLTILMHIMLDISEHR